MIKSRKTRKKTSDLAKISNFVSNGGIALLVNLAIQPFGYCHLLWCMLFSFLKQSIKSRLIYNRHPDTYDI